jgi:hypothetical protein
MYTVAGGAGCPGSWMGTGMPGGCGGSWTGFSPPGPSVGGGGGGIGWGFVSGLGVVWASIGEQVRQFQWRGPWQVPMAERQRPARASTRAEHCRLALSVEISRGGKPHRPDHP